MTSGNAQKPVAQGLETTSGNTQPRLRGRRPAQLPPPYDRALADYGIALEGSPLADSSRAKYLSRVRGFLAFVAEASADGMLDGDPLADPAAAAWAVRDYRRHLKNGRRAPITIDNVLAAVDDFHARAALAVTPARRERAVRRTAPKALDERRVRRYLREVEKNASTRDAVIALLPYLAGLRIGEVVALEVADVRLSARKGELRVLGKGHGGGKIRTVDLHPDLRTALQAWLQERATWPGAAGAALVLNVRGGRLSDRAARDIIVRLGAAAGINDDVAEPFGPHVLRHTFGTQLVRAGKDLILVAELMGHERLDTTRQYTLPTSADRAAALEALITDH
ncbi:tyrosine-type recombinase/integrase [Streptosporangium sp. NBC_01755]|uniref:tyrosine-type recombinase/integrase n=1 Tax=unclassified Streptosporangium TaxID=2632669 RepID=UPI002DD8C2DF|nr:MULTISPECIES: tyrosine-type recombinase/integrase [unclassified Streptosporangium]WSA28404.1 tyrosine-type recombinase/integrase [Streptosporangium sp. NBC_01810]WSD00106.1 tyrosine-type recombinase/integrase [Streptosporangium sp. NBC_01755]